MFAPAAKLKYSLQKMFRAAADEVKFSCESKMGLNEKR